jgi:hypothetical protein
MESSKEHDTWCSSPGLIEDIANIGFRFTEPHCEKFRSLLRDMSRMIRGISEEKSHLDADEIGIALIGNGLGE